MEKMEEFMQALGEVARLAEEVGEIETQTLVQEVQMLDQITDRLLPVMRFIDYRIKKSGGRGGHQFAEWSYGYYKEKGIIVVDKTKERMGGSDTRGEYQGWLLILTRSGKWVKLEREGNWSRWQNEGSEFWSTDFELPTADAVKLAGFEHIIHGILEDFKDAIEKAEKKRMQLGSRMKTLEAIKGLMNQERV